MKKLRHQAFTLVELCIAMALMSVIAALSVSLISLSAKSFAVSAQRLDAAMQDASFVQRFNDAVRQSGTAFTIPKNSFTVPNLTAGWSYFGLMEDVTVPAEVSRTGKEITGTNALVFIEYAGTTRPTDVPAGSELIQNSDGWFIRTVIAHDYTDANGQLHQYSLNIINHHSNNQVMDHFALELTTTVSEDETLLESSVLRSFMDSLNAIQIIYNGSELNPAVALAFRMDFMPTVSTSVTGTQTKATVVMCMDVSGSMNATRMKTLQDAAQSFINELATNPNINILLVPFSYYADCPTNFKKEITWNGKNNVAFPEADRKLDITNAQQYKDDLCKTVLALQATGDTNLGDALRVAYHKLKADPTAARNPVFLLVMTDGENNTLTVDYGYNASCDPSHYYTGNAVYQDKSTNSGYLRINNDNANMNNGTIVANRVLPSYPYAASVVYYQMIGQLIKNDYNPTAYIINGFGVSTTNEANLRTVFPEITAFDATSLTEFNNTLTQIGADITDIMWAFDGPRL